MCWLPKDGRAYHRISYRSNGHAKGERQWSLNPELPLGSIEIDVQEYSVLGKATELPIQVKEGDDNEVSEDVRLRYRYIDLRREKMQKIMKLRSSYSHALRQAFIDRDFVEVETPILSKATMEGARLPGSITFPTWQILCTPSKSSAIQTITDGRWCG